MRFVISALALLSSLFLGLACVLSVLLGAVVLGRWLEGRYQAGFALFAGGFALLMAAVCGWLAWRTMRHLRAPDQRTAKDVSAVTCFLLGIHLLGVIMRNSLPAAARDASAVYWETAGSIVAGFLVVLLYRYVLCNLADRTYPPKPPRPLG